MQSIARCARARVGFVVYACRRRCFVPLVTCVAGNGCRHDAPKPSRGGQARGTCPWAQDSDTNQFARGPPSSRGKRGDGYGGASAVAPTRTSFKPQGSSSAPWAADEAPVWDKPMNAYGAGLNAAPASGYGYGNNQYAEPLPDDDDYGYGAPPPSMPVARSPMQGRGGGGAAPWATDENEPIISVSRSSQFHISNQTMHRQCSHYQTITEGHADVKY